MLMLCVAERNVCTTRESLRTAMLSRAGEPVLMSDRKPANQTWESFADRRIREAEEAGQFENLSGFGKPIPGIDQPLDENWWVKRKLRDEQLSVVPPVLEARRAIERTREEILQLSDETDVRHRLEALNELIHKAIRSPIPGPPSGVMPVDIESELYTWRIARSECR